MYSILAIELSQAGGHRQGGQDCHPGSVCPPGCDSKITACKAPSRWLIDLLGPRCFIYPFSRAPFTFFWGTNLLRVRETISEKKGTSFTRFQSCGRSLSTALPMTGCTFQEFGFYSSACSCYVNRPPTSFSLRVYFVATLCDSALGLFYYPSIPLHFPGRLLG
jgi:hypothetical protein